MPPDGEKGESSSHQVEERSEPQTADQKHTEKHDPQYDSGAQIRLHQRQNYQRSNQGKRQPDVVQPISPRRLIILEIFGHHKNDGNLRRLRGLQSKKSQIDPALGAAAGMADHQDQNQQEKYDAIKGIGDAIDMVIVKSNSCQHSDQAEP